MLAFKITLFNSIILKIWYLYFLRNYVIEFFIVIFNVQNRNSRIYLFFTYENIYLVGNKTKLLSENNLKNSLRNEVF